MTSSRFFRLEAFHTGIWKSDSSFITMVYWHISRDSYRFGVIRPFILAGICSFRTILGVCFFRVKHPQISQLHISHPQKGLSCSGPLLRAKMGSRIWAVALLNNIKTKTKSQDPYMLRPSGVWTAHRTWTNFGRAGDLPNFITHAQFEINWDKIVTLAKRWSFMFLHYYGGRH